VTTICAKCQLVRPEHTDAPLWQCPGCGVAYNKAGDARANGSLISQRQHPARAVSESESFSWVKWLLVLALIWGAYTGYQAVYKRGEASGEIASISSRLDSRASTEQLAALAARNQPEDVLMYSAEWCPYCRAAKGWMAQYGFKYEECDIDKTAGCNSQLAGLGGGGVPYLIVKGHHMKNGFDSDEFLAALQSK